MATESLPLFYNRIERLNAKRHAQLGIVPDAKPLFAQNTNSVPLAVSEFAVAMAHYPIVFVGGDLPLPVAILGLDNDQNLFMAEDGSWMPGAYVPAYIRRYPFIFIGGGDGSKLILGVDTDSALVAPNTDRPLFVDGQQTDHTQKVIKFCQEFQKQMALTEAFSREVADAGLFEEKFTNLRLPDGRQLRLGPFKVVNTERLEAVDDERFLTWRKRGLLPILYWHLGSQSQWTSLVARLR